MKVNRWLVLPVVFFGLLFALPAFAFEVLIQTTPTKIPCNRIRKGLVLQNKGANSLYCSTFVSTDATSALGLEVAAGAVLGLDATCSAAVYCSTSSNQSSGSGTRVIEL